MNIQKITSTKNIMLAFQAAKDNVRSIKFNQALSGELTKYYDVATYEIDFKNGDTMIVPANDYQAVA